MEPKELEFGKVIEDKTGERTYVKHVLQSHKMKIHNAWGFQKTEVARMNQLRVSKVKLLVKYDGAYEADMESVNSALEGDYGFGKQKFVPVAAFRKVN